MKQRFVQGTLYSVGGMAVSTLALLVAGKLLTNTLAPEHVGEFALLLLSAEFLGMLVNLGLPATLPKLLQARESDRRADLLSSLRALQGAIALAVAALCGLAAMIGESWLPLVESWLPLPQPLLGLLPLLLAAVALRDFFLAGAAGFHDYRRRAGAVVLIASLQVLFFTTLFFLDSSSPLPFAAAHLAATTAGTLFLAVGMPRGGRLEWHEAKRCLGFSGPLFANNLLNFLYQRVDTLLVVFFLGLKTAAFFEMAKRIPGVLNRFFGAVLIPYLPSVAELLRNGEQDRAARLLQRVSTYAAFTGYGMTLAIVAIQKPLLHVLFTEDYAGAAPVLGPLLIAACLTVQAGVMGQALIALDRPRWVMYSNMSLAVTGVGLNLLLLPRLGPAGAGWSAVAAALCSYLLQRIAVARAGIAVPAGRATLVHVFFIFAYAVALNRGDAPLHILAAAIVYVAACLLLRIVSVREAVATFRRAVP